MKTDNEREQILSTLLYLSEHVKSFALNEEGFNIYAQMVKTLIYLEKSIYELNKKENLAN